MFYFKPCPRCHCDLHGGEYISCVQCSHYLTEREETLLKLAVSGLDVSIAASAEPERVAA